MELINTTPARTPAYQMLEDLHDLVCGLELTPPEDATKEDVAKIANEFIERIHNDAQEFLANNKVRDLPVELHRHDGEQDKISRLEIMDGLGDGTIDPHWVDIPAMMRDMAKILRHMMDEHGWEDS